MLYHANYFHVLEHCREELLASGGRPYSSLVRQQQHFVLGDARLKYVRPIAYGEAVVIRCQIPRLAKATVEIVYEVSYADSPETLRHCAWTKLGFVAKESEGFQLRPIPSDIREIFQRHQGNFEGSFFNEYSRSS